MPQHVSGHSPASPQGSILSIIPPLAVLEAAVAEAVEATELAIPVELAAMVTLAATVELDASVTEALAPPKPGEPPTPSFPPAPLPAPKYTKSEPHPHANPRRQTRAAGPHRRALECFTFFCSI